MKRITNYTKITKYTKIRFFCIFRYFVIFVYFVIPLRFHTHKKSGFACCTYGQSALNFRLPIPILRFFRFLKDAKMLGGGLRKPDRFKALLVLALDRKSTRLNSSHLGISYAV